MFESRCWASAASSSSSVTSPSRRRSDPKTGRRSLSASFRRRFARDRLVRKGGLESHDVFHRVIFHRLQRSLARFGLQHCHPRGDLDRRRDRIGRSDGPPDSNPEHAADVVEACEPARVGHRNEQRPVGEETDREGRAAAGKLLGKLRRHGADRVGLVEIDEGQLVLFRDEPRHLLGRDHAAFHEGLTEPLTGDPAVTAIALLGERSFELRSAHQAVTDEQHAEGRPGRRCRSFHFPSDRRISLRT